MLLCAIIPSNYFNGSMFCIGFQHNKQSRFLCITFRPNMQRRRFRFRQQNPQTQIEQECIWELCGLRHQSISFCMDDGWFAFTNRKARQEPAKRQKTPKIKENGKKCRTSYPMQVWQNPRNSQEVSTLYNTFYFSP